jgi:hypothetical protein
MITIATIREHIDALEDKFGMDANVAYSNVSMTQLSIARHYGGCKVGSHHYVYNPTDDSLIREDVVKWLTKEIKKKAKAEVKPKQETKSLDLSE